MTDNYDPNFREWAPDEYEQWLPESWDEFNADNRLKRVERLSRHIKAGADRTMCRMFVYTEEEWRSGCLMAQKEPGHGWIMQPGAEHKPVAPPKPAEMPVQSELVTIGEMIRDAFDEDLPF
jgi:hypothetical protein